MKSTFKINYAALAVAIALILYAIGLVAPKRALAANDSTAQQGDAGASDLHRLVAVLEYLETDYPAAVSSGLDSELAEQRAFVADAVKTAHAAGPILAPFVDRLLEIQSKVEHAQDPEGVRDACAKLVEDVVAAAGLARSPRVAPDLSRGEALYRANCVQCHAQDGSSKVEIAAAMHPPPANFLDPERMNGVTPYRAFNAIGFGVKGTTMPAFMSFDENDRWALAFYVLTLRRPPCDHTPPRVSLEELATSTDVALGNAHGENEVGCLRRTIPSADEEGSLLVARAKVDDAIARVRSGDWDGAKKAILSAYLDGIEPIEPMLRSRDAALVAEMEGAFNEARVAIDEHREGPAIDAARRFQSLLDRARKAQGAKNGAWSVFWLSLLIVIREGFEATVILAALLAVLKKTKQTDQAKVVHAGWIVAVILGIAAFALGHRLTALLGGARRELFEGVLALVAVAMILHAALWLNARGTTRKMMGELREKVSGAVSRRSSTALFFIAFTAMGRESFETAVFLQGLSIDSSSAVAWGSLVGLIALIALIFSVDRLGVRLPMRALFSVSTVVLVVTAIILLGKGIHALQETGLLPIKPIHFVSFDLLGLYADLYSLIPQATLAMAPLMWKLFARLRQRRTAHVARNAE